MAQAQYVTINVNVQLGDFEKLLDAYLKELETDAERERASKVLEDFIYWMLKRDAKG